MNGDLAPEMEKAAQKAKTLDRRAVHMDGQGSSIEHRIFSEYLVDNLIDYITEDLRNSHRNSEYAEALPRIQTLGSERIAVCCLQSVFDKRGKTLVPMQEHCGRQMAMELFVADYEAEHGKDALEDTKKALNKRNLRIRQNTLTMLAKRRKFEAKHWDNRQAQAVGLWMVNCVTQCFPELFELVQLPTGEYRLDVTAKGVSTIDTLKQDIRLKPVYLPVSKQPAPWRGFNSRSGDPRIDYRDQLVKTMYQSVIGAHRAAIADGGMQPTLDAVNALQGVPWRINRWVYDTMVAMASTGEMLPVERSVPVPDKPEWGTEGFHDKLYKYHESVKRNAQIRGDVINYREDMRTAASLLDQDRFWIRYNMDWRGRVYALSNFNFQRDDRVRALFQFSDGVPIDAEGRRQLAYHVATQGEFREDGVRINKARIEDRIAWTHRHLGDIYAAATDPLGSKWWRDAENPWVFLAACREYMLAVEANYEGREFITHLPIAFDGSCNGLQHLSLLSGDEQTAELVNLVDNETPKDIYTVIGEDARQQFLSDACSDSDYGAIAAVCLTMDPRKLSKRNTMTFGYSSEGYGMAGQIQEDLIDKLQNEVIDSGRTKTHPFAPFDRSYAGKPSKAARYIGQAVNFPIIKARLPKPHAVMKFMQKVSDAMAHEAKPVLWTTPMGMPWANGKYRPVSKQMKLSLRAYGIRIKSKVNEGFSREILKKKSANGIAPNLVHALDAAHLMASVNAGAAEGIVNVATVHDCYCCLAPQAKRLNEIIREQLVAMYTKHDVLQEILDAAKRDLTQPNWDRLPPVPKRGTLDLNEITKATYAFA